MSSSRGQKSLRLSSIGAQERLSESKLLQRFRSFGSGSKDKVLLDFEFEKSPAPRTSAPMRSSSSSAVRKPQTVGTGQISSGRQQSNRIKESSSFGRANTFQEKPSRNSIVSNGSSTQVKNRNAPNISHHGIAMEQYSSSPSERGRNPNSASPLSPLELHAHYRRTRKVDSTRNVGYATAHSFSSVASTSKKERGSRELIHQPETAEYADYVSNRVWDRVKEAQLTIESQGTLSNVDSAQIDSTPKNVDTESGDEGGQFYGYEKMYTALSPSMVEVKNSSDEEGESPEQEEELEATESGVEHVVEEIAEGVSEEEVDDSEYLDADEGADAATANAGVSSDHEAYTPDMIAAEVQVRKTSNKGRCLYTRKSREPGDIIFVEDPVMVAVPSLNKKLWKLLSALNDESEFSLPPIWHLAAISSLTTLPKASRDIILDKWVPDPEAKPSVDVVRVLGRWPPLKEHNVHGRVYQRALEAWRFNSFGHHTEENGLVLFNSISMMAHSCHATATWHYGKGSAFVLRARQNLPVGGEISISYIGDEELCKPTHLRREHLSSWLFTCACDRCTNPIDYTRGFRCSSCGVGTFYLKSESPVRPEEGGALPVATTCDCCEKLMTTDDIEEFVKLEDAYISRLDETDSTDLQDACNVFHEAQRMFASHWVLCNLHQILFEAFRTQGNIYAALHHQRERIRFLTSTLPKASFTVAWLHENLGDVVATKLVEPSLLDTDEPMEIDPYLRLVITRAYEDVYNLMAILCGYHHEYTHTARAKLDRILATSDVGAAAYAEGGEVEEVEEE